MSFANEEWTRALSLFNFWGDESTRVWNNDARLLMAMIHARDDIRNAQYDIALLHLEEILRRKPEEERVKKFCHMVKRALKLQQKLKERERCIDIEEKDVMKETRNCFCF